MNVAKLTSSLLTSLLIFVLVARSQDSTAPNAKPTDRVLGAITRVDMPSKQVFIKEDSTGAEYSVSLNATKTFLKVPPGEKDLKKASRIDATQLNVGDRVAIRGHKPEGSSNSIEAASVLVMTASDLEQKHQTELADWKQRGTVGLVASFDAPGQKLTMTARAADGSKTYAVDLSKATEFTRFSPDSPNNPTASKISEIQTGDQIRVLGAKDEGSSEITAEKVYSGSFRTISATVLSVSPDGKDLTVNDLQTKQPMKVQLTEESSIRKMPPEMASMIAARATSASGAGQANGAKPPSGAPAGSAEQPDHTNAASPSQGPRGRGDLSQMVERLPKIPSTDLKAGDAVVISGALATDRTHLLAITVVAGVEPLFRSGQARSGQSSAGSDWNLGLSIPEQ